jgi:hypothetical protein
VGLRDAGSGWDLAFFVKNLIDNHTAVAADVAPVPNTYGLTAVRVATLQPRTDWPAGLIVAGQLTVLHSLTDLASEL